MYQGYKTKAVQLFSKRELSLYLFGAVEIFLGKHYSENRNQIVSQSFVHCLCVHAEAKALGYKALIKGSVLSLSGQKGLYLAYILVCACVVLRQVGGYIWYKGAVRSKNRRDFVGNFLFDFLGAYACYNIRRQQKMKGGNKLIIILVC